MIRYYFINVKNHECIMSRESIKGIFILFILIGSFIIMICQFECFHCKCKCKKNQVNIDSSTIVQATPIEIRNNEIIVIGEQPSETNQISPIIVDAFVINVVNE